MIVIEGTDCVGKSTLVKRLSQRLPFMKTQHFGLLDDNWDFYHGYLPYINRGVILDRFIMSEPIYRWAQEDEPRITPFVYGLLAAKMRLVGCVNVLITCRDDCIRHDGPQDFTEDITRAANLQFICPQSNDYSFETDIHWNRFHPNQWPAEDDNLIMRIIECWYAKQDQLDAVIRRQRATL